MREGEREREKVGGRKGAREEGKGSRGKEKGRGSRREEKGREAEGKGVGRGEEVAFRELREMFSLVIVEVSLLLLWEVLSFGYHM